MIVVRCAILAHAVGQPRSGVNPDYTCNKYGMIANSFVVVYPWRCFMLDVLPDIERWRAQGERVAIATVVSMAGSAPRRPGAKLAVSESGELAGSVSGGCVEPAVFQTAMEVIADGKPQMLEFGIS